MYVSWHHSQARILALLSFLSSHTCVGFSADSIMVAPYPQADSALEDDNSEAQIKAMQDIVSVARSMRDSYGLKPSMRPVLFVKCRSKVESMREEADNIKTLVKCESVTVMGDGEEPDKGCGEQII